MNKKTFIKLPTHRGVEFICPDDIVSVYSETKTICITFENKQKSTIKISIGEAEKVLSGIFFARCHQRYIVNVLKIKEVINGYSEIILTNKEQIPVSRTYKKAFKQTVNSFCINERGGKLLIVSS